MCVRTFVSKNHYCTASAIACYGGVVVLKSHIFNLAVVHVNQHGTTIIYAVIITDDTILDNEMVVRVTF